MQIGILQHALRQFKAAMKSFQNALDKMKNGTLMGSPLVGLVINQMGLTSIELGDVPQAARFFEESRAVMDTTVGPQHLDTLDVCNNLACTYANLGRYGTPPPTLLKTPHSSYTSAKPWLPETPHYNSFKVSYYGHHPIVRND